MAVAPSAAQANQATTNSGQLSRCRSTRLPCPIPRCRSPDASEATSLARRPYVHVSAGASKGAQTRNGRSGAWSARAASSVHGLTPSTAGSADIGTGLGMRPSGPDGRAARHVPERDVTIEARLGRQPQHALAEDVALDLVGACRDAEPGRAQQQLRPGERAPLTGVGAQERKSVAQ